MTIEHRLTASGWHDGYWSPLYVYASTGVAVPGLDDEIDQCLHYVERIGPEARFDPLEEHRRLTELLHHIEPLLAAETARGIGRGEGCAAADAWQDDRLNGPWADHVARVAQRVYEALKDNRSAASSAVVAAASS